MDSEAYYLHRQQQQHQSDVHSQCPQFNKISLPRRPRDWQCTALTLRSPYQSKGKLFHRPLVDCESIAQDRMGRARYLMVTPYQIGYHSPHSSRIQRMFYKESNKTANYPNARGGHLVQLVFSELFADPYKLNPSVL